MAKNAVEDPPVRDDLESYTARFENHMEGWLSAHLCSLSALARHIRDEIYDLADLGGGELEVKKLASWLRAEAVAFNEAADYAEFNKEDMRFQRNREL